jgi:hypothetical protein
VADPVPKQPCQNEGCRRPRRVASERSSIAGDTDRGILGTITDKLAKILADIRRNPNNVRFADLLFVCRHYFGEPRSQGTSHYVFKMPWPGDPRVNIQDKGGKATPYQEPYSKLGQSRAR